MAAAQDPLVGTLVSGRYRVHRLLGEGGMGQVYLAEHEAIQKKIALKILRAEYSNKQEIITRFQQEAISASRIKHPNVLDVFDFGEIQGGFFFLAMEFLDGHDLADELVRTQVVPPERGVMIALQVCRALAAAHARGVVHRDMKPENVFLQQTADGEEIVKIVDFGIAQLRAPGEPASGETQRRRLTRTGMIFGTPEYMSPEQAGGLRADHRADIYAVGIILYEMFTNAVPFTGETFLGVLNRHQHDPVPPMASLNPQVAISQPFQDVIFRALQKKPEDRFQSMAEFAQAIAATPEGQAVRNRSPLSSGLDLIGEMRSILPPLPNFTGIPTGPALAPAGAEPPARAQTQLEAGVPARKDGKTRWGLFGVALLTLGAAGAGGLFMFGREPEPVELKPPEASPVPALPRPSALAAPGPAVTPIEQKPEVAPATVEPVSKIKLSVESSPSGAVVKKGDFQVCDQTPCEVLADPEETLELVAIRGNRVGRVRVLAQGDQRVIIPLAAPPKPKPQPKGHLCEVEVDGIKILRPCR